MTSSDDPTIASHRSGRGIEDRQSGIGNRRSRNADPQRFIDMRENWRLEISTLDSEVKCVGIFALLVSHYTARTDNNWRREAINYYPKARTITMLSLNTRLTWRAPLDIDSHCKPIQWCIHARDKTSLHITTGTSHHPVSPIFQTTNQTDCCDWVETLIAPITLFRSKSHSTQNSLLYTQTDLPYCFQITEIVVFKWILYIY